MEYCQQFADLMIESAFLFTSRFPMHPGKSWEVLKFKKEIFQAWKVMEKSWNFTSRS